MSRWRLDLEGGERLILRAGVTLIGRHPRCDIVLRDSSVSRRQLLLNTHRDGVELVNLGRQRVSCDGAEVIDEAVLGQHGAQIKIGVTPFASLHRTEPDDEAPRWQVRIDGGPGIAVTRSPFVIGGGPVDDLALEAWPPEALVLSEHPTGMSVELSVAGRQLLSPAEAASFDGGGIGRLSVDRPLSIAGRQIALDAMSATSLRSTIVADTRPELRLETCGRGGLLTITKGTEVQSVYLARLRFALLRALIVPAPPAAPGDYVDLERLCEAVWSDPSEKTEYDFNVLLHRLRRDLVRAEIDVGEVIERARGSGQLRAPIARDARVLLDPHGEPGKHG